VAYVRFDPGFTRHRKLNALSYEDRWRAIEAVDWAVLSGANGIVMVCDVTAVWHGCDKRKALRIAARLTAAGILEERPASAGGGWKIHDFEDYQLSAEAVSEQRRKAAERQRRYRERQAAAGAGEGAKAGGARDAVTHKVTRESRRSRARVPLPPPPLRGGGGESVTHEDAGRPGPGSAGPSGVGEGKSNGTPRSGDLEHVARSGREVVDRLKRKGAA